MKPPGKAYRRRLILSGAIAVAVLLLGFYASPGVKVRVANETGAEIAEIEIRFTGGRESRPRLQAGATFATRVRPRGESSLDVAFKDATGKPHYQQIDVYFERGYRGKIDITIRPGGAVLWKDETQVGAALPFGL